MFIIWSDHGGFRLKNAIVDRCNKQQIPVVDKGIFSETPVDYPDVAQTVCDIVLDSGDTQCFASPQTPIGILVCGTGIGMSIAANKVPGIRAAVLHTTEEARLAREHNNCNVICFGGRTMQERDVLACIEIFSQATFAGERHAKRVEKLGKMTRHGFGCVN